jgi:hypothetical protein
LVASIPNDPSGQSTAIFTVGANTAGGIYVGGGYGLKIFDKTSNSGSGQTGYGVYISAPYDGTNASGGTYALTKYGVYVDDIYSFYGINSGTGNTNWGLYIKGGASNYIAGNLLVGTTSDIAGNLAVGVFNQNTASRGSLVAKNVTTGNETGLFWNADTSGDNRFIGFYTETSITSRGAITYNRAGGLTVYGTTSDYRAKDIYGPVSDSGALIDSIPVYMGKMKGATQERPMFIAHETPNYAHTGVKDAVDADGNPVYQQMDASALIPVMWAEIQSLRIRIAQLEAK